MEKKIKTIITMAMACIMLFAVFVFGGAGCNMVATVQERVDSASLRVQTVLNDDYALFVDIDALLDELEELHSDALQLRGDNAILLTRIYDYKAQLRVLRTELEQPREIPFEIHFFDTIEVSWRYLNPLRFVDNFAYLYTIIYENCPASAAIESYTAEFFENNILVVAVVWSPNSGVWLNSSSAFLEKDTMSVQLHIGNGPMATLTTGVALIELRKADIRNASTLEAFLHRPIVNHVPELIGYTNL